MYISLKDSCAKGFNKWANTYEPEIKNDLGMAGSAATSPDQDNSVMTSLEGRRRPRLVPGAETF